MQDSIPRRPRSGPSALSFAQERLWFLHEIAPESPVYNIAVAVQFPGTIDVGALERSLGRLIERHEILRTTFRSKAGHPVAVVSAAFDTSVSVIDVRDHGDREQRLAQLCADLVNEPFDLSTGPLVRWLTLRLDEEDYRLQLVLHHIVADGWSLEILVRELKALYADEVEGRQTVLVAPLQYADFAAWQRTRVERGDLQADIDWWTRRLANAPDSLDLPVDHSRRASQSFAGATQFFSCAPRLTERLRDLAKTEGVTLFMLLLAAFKVLLHRYSGHRDIVVGTPIANRTRAQLEEVIGCFVNTLVLRTDVSDGVSFRALLRQVRGVTVDAYAHQEAPFEQLVATLRPDRGRSLNPLFQVLFAFQNLPAFDPGDVGYDPSGVPVTGTAKFELSAALVESNDRLCGAIEYRTDLFGHDTIKRLISHYRTLLSALVEDPDCTIAAVPLLSEAEIRQMDAWQGPKMAPGPLVHQLFEAQAQSTPDAIAVDVGVDRLTYRELDERANQLAHYLRSTGVQRGARIGLCLARSVDLVIALYAALKCGAAYVPIDPDYPADRIALMAEDSAVAVLLTSRHEAARVGSSRSTMLVLDEVRAEIAVQSRERLANDAAAEDVIYVIYTSGSTGRPKGVAVTHGGFANMMRWFIQDFAINAADRNLVVTSLSFDLTQKNYFATLAVGGAVCLAPEGLFNPEEIVGSIGAQQITRLNCTPSMAYAMVETGGDFFPALQSLTTLFLGGEPIDVRRLLPWTSSRFFLGEIVNTYGPTECADITTFYRLESFERFRERSVPIGRPIPNTEVFVLDSSLNRVPFGVIGELYIAGAGVSAGYVQDAGLTAERFLPHPFTETAGARMYRSGDLVRQRSNGMIDFVGRIDQQFKLRGVRIELGEIEAVLSQHPAVRAVVATLAGKDDLDRNLLVYVVPDDEQAGPVRAAVRMRLESSLERGVGELPNGLKVFHQNLSETEFLYREIFEEDAYLRHGISLPEDACVFDVGANIGLFALSIAFRRPKATILAFEPIPPVCETLRLNARLYGLEVSVFEVALASTNGRASLSHYPNATIISGRFADPMADREAVRRYLLARLTDADARVTDADITDILDQRLGTEPFDCRTQTLSQIIREQRIERIDLLKIDVEKSEFDVLLGLEPEHWPLVRQIVLEVHDIEGRLEHVRQMLGRAGFEVVVEQDSLLAETNIHTVYGRRASIEPTPAPPPMTLPKWTSAEALSKDLTTLARATVPAHLVPARICFVEALPLTPSGKIDRSRLPAPDASDTPPRSVAPRTELELQIASIWADLLQIQGIGIRDNFFELGGHSLLATRVVARIRDRFGVAFPLRLMFERPTIEGIAAELLDASRTGEPSALEAVR